VAQGQRSDDHSTATLVIIYQENGSWSIHGLGVSGVRLSKTDMTAVAESILGAGPVTTMTTDPASRRAHSAVAPAVAQRYLDQLTATVQARSVLAEVIALAEQAPTLTKDQLRFRLLALAVRAAPRSTAAPRSPAARRSSDPLAPGGQPVPRCSRGRG
jgi:hypothetical protein